MKKRISVEEELFDRIKRLRRSEEEPVATVVQRAIYGLEGDEILNVEWDDKIVLDRPIIPAVKEAMLSGELTRDTDWFTDWLKRHNIT